MDLMSGTRVHVPSQLIESFPVLLFVTLGQVKKKRGEITCTTCHQHERLLNPISERERKTERQGRAWTRGSRSAGERLKK